MTLGKLEDTGNRKRENLIALCGYLAVEAAVDLSYGKGQNEMYIITNLF